MGRRLLILLTGPLAGVAMTANVVAVAEAGVRAPLNTISTSAMRSLSMAATRATKARSSFR